MTQDSIKGWVRGFSTAPPILPSHAVPMSQLLNTAKQGQPWHSRKLEWGPSGRSASAQPQPHAQPRGTPGRKEVWPGLCVSPVSVWRSWLPTCQGQQGPGAGGALCVYVGVGSSAGHLYPVCDPALEGSCPVSPEGATTKVAGRWWGRWLNGPGPSVADCSVSGLWLGLSQGTGRPVLLPLTPPAAGSLSASPMPYAWAHCHRICNMCG